MVNVPDLMWYKMPPSSPTRRVHIHPKPSNSVQLDPSLPREERWKAGLIWFWANMTGMLNSVPMSLYITIYDV